MAFFMFFLPGPSHTNTLAGFFLVIAHCFYGLNFLNMWPCFIAPFLYLTVKQLDYNENLHVCMFSTCFSPFVSELLFRYTLGDSFSIIRVTLTVRGVLLTVLFSLIIAFCTPALLPGARTWHKGYNLYNGGLACGVFAFLLYSFLYRTVGVSEPRVPMTVNPVYASFGNSYHLFGNVFFLILFGCSAALHGEFHVPQNMGSGFWWLVVLGGLAQTGIYFFYYRNLKHFEVWLVKLYLLLMPVLSCFIGVFFLNEDLTVKKLLGILVVLAGAAVILQRGRINHSGRPARES